MLRRDLFIVRTRREKPCMLKMKINGKRMKNRRRCIKWLERSQIKTQECCPSLKKRIQIVSKVLLDIPTNIIRLSWKQWAEGVIMILKRKKRSLKRFPRK